MNRIYRIDWGACSALFPSIRKPAPDHRQSQFPVQQLPALTILCILSIHVLSGFFIYMDEQDIQDIFPDYASVSGVL